jgi:hypothetical protein
LDLTDSGNLRRFLFSVIGNQQAPASDRPCRSAISGFRLWTTTDHSVYSFFRNVRLLFSFCEKTGAYNPNYITTSVVFLLSIFWNNLGPEEVFFMSGKTCFSKRQDDLMMLLSIRVSVSRYSLCQADPILFRFSLTFLPQLLLKVGKTLGFVGITNRD